MSNGGTNLKQLLTIPETAAVLQLCTKTVCRWTTRGESGAHRFGRRSRIAPAELKQLLKRRMA